MRLVKGWWVPDYDNDMEVNLGEPQFAGRSTYQFYAFRELFPHFHNFRCALDVGAHIGTWSHMLAQCFRQVKAWEPVPEHAECFRENKPADNVEFYQCALSNRTAHLEMAIRPPVSLKARVKTNEPEGFWVPATKLDDCEINAPVDFIKIDVEGFELQVIEGGEETIRAHKPLMFVEQKPGNTKRYGLELEAIELLKGWGAKVKFEVGGDWCLAWE